MKKIFKIYITILMMTITLGLVGCSNNSKTDAIQQYTKAWKDRNYDEMYEALSQESKEYISKEDFIKRYSTIYSGIGVNNIEVEVKEENKDKKTLINIRMNTIAGDIKFEDKIVDVVKEDNQYKVLWDEGLIIPGMIKDDKLKYQIEKGVRGKILDRDGNLLAYDGEANQVYIHPRVFEVNKEEKINSMSKILDKSLEFIQGKLENKNPEHLIPIVKISIYEQEKADLIEGIEGVTVKKEPSRVYADGEAFGNLIGYIGDITKEKLEVNEGKGYSQYSKIGIKGLEQVYEEKLRAKDGVCIYIERGEEKIEIAKTDTVNGEDIQLSIDSNLQKDIYTKMNQEKGASVALDPKSGEVLAMVSSPSYDSNTLVTYKSDSIIKLYEESQNAQFDNRANNAYSPGSTMKLITTAIGLENNIINPNETMDIKGLNWQKDSSWGNYKVTRVKDPGRTINLYDAIKYSDNIYFADKAIKIGEKKFLEGVKKFGIGEELPFEYPMEQSQVSNNGKLESEILLGDSGYGQGQVLMTPLDVAMVYSALGNEGKIMVPRLVISENSQAKVYKEAINSGYLQGIINYFSGVINDSDGTGNLAKIQNVNLVGKTGTAEIKKSKDDENGTQNGWFAAVEIDNSKIAISMIIEDIKDRYSSEYVVSMVKNILENYLK